MGLSGVALGRHSLPLTARMQSARGVYVVADTWRSRPDVRPADAWSLATGIDVTADGVFVADDGPGLPRITLRQPDGTAQTLVSGAPLVHPAHVAVDAARERLYVTDLGQDALVVFNLAGVPLASWLQVPGANGVAVGADGTAYVTASATGEIHRFSPTGERLPVWEVVPKVQGGGLLAGVAVDAAGYVHVLDGRSPRVHRLDGRGHAIEETDVAVSGKLVDLAVEIDDGGSGQRRYWFATSDGLVFMDEGGAPNLVALGQLTAVAVQRDRGVFATAPLLSRGVSRVAQLDYGATLSGRGLPVWHGGLLTAAGVLNGPERIEVGADGQLYVLDRALRVQRFSPQGVPLRQMYHPGPIAADAGPDGTVYVADGDRLGAEVFVAPDLDGQRVWRTDLWTPAAPDTFAADVVFDGSVAPGSLVVLDILGRALRRFDLRGQPLGTPVALSGGPTASPPLWADLAVDEAGTAYVLNRGTPEVRVVPPSGAPRTMTLKAAARRVAVAPDGTLLALARDGWVWRYGTDGTLAGVFDARRVDVSPSSRPTDLTVDAGGSVFVTDRNANIVTRFAWDPDAAPPNPPPTEPVCQGVPNKRASPETLPLGETVDVELLVRGECGATIVAPPLDVFLILDRSGSMLDDRRMEIARQAALDLVHELDLSQSRIGVVTFNHDATLDIGLTNEEGRLWRAVNGMAIPFGSTAIDLGLRVARQAWQPVRRAGVRTVFIVLSDGSSERVAAMAEAGAAKAEDVEIFTIGVKAPDPELLRDIATDATRFFQTDDPNLLFQVFAAIVQRITARALYRTIEVFDEVPANMAYIDGSASAGGTFDPATRILRWTLADVPFNGFVLRYRVRPLEAGLWPTNVAAWATFVDGFDKPGRLDFPVPQVLVVAPTATPTLTPTPVPTPTPTPRPVYIPIALRERCDVEHRHTDAILVMDTSGSMVGAKLQAAKDAAIAFTRALGFKPDDQGRFNQVAVVAFDSQARLVVPLTNDLARIEAGIAGLRTATGTYIDLGLQAAMAEMRSGRRRDGNTPTIVLLTDGINSGDDDAVQALGDQLCAGGILLYTIGLGSDDDVDADFLKDVACEPDMAFLAPRPEDLLEIYDKIAGEIPCAAEGFWGRR